MSRRWALWGLAVVAGLLVLSAIVWVVWKVPQMQVQRLLTDPNYTEGAIFDAEDKARNTLLKAFGGGFFFITAFVGLRQLQVAEENRKIAEKTRQITEDKNVTERFVKAVEMLADDKQEIRLGAIYALERIAENSPTDRQTIGEVLAAFIRRRAAKPNSEQPIGAYLPEDIATALNAILRPRKLDGEDVVPLIPDLDLRNTDLRRADLKGCSLRWAKLCHTDLREARFWAADLSYANLRGADLSYADFGGANLDSAELTDANLAEADLDRANLAAVQGLSQEGLMKARNWKSAFHDTIAFNNRFPEPPKKLKLMRWLSSR